MSRSAACVCSTGIASDFALPLSWKKTQQETEAREKEAQISASAAVLERTVLNSDKKFDSRRS